MNELKLSNIPMTLREHPQWIVWKLIDRDGKPTKVPFHPNGLAAKSDDPDTWVAFDEAARVVDRFSGIGFVFSKDDPFTGIDLDGCRDPQTGQVAEWARAAILSLASYAEVSPSGTGVKIWIVGKSPMARGRKVAIDDADKITDKEPGIEVYDERRYFAMTGWKLKGPSEPTAAQEQLDKLCMRYFPEPIAPVNADYHSEDAVVERARKYLAKLPPAVSGSSGHNATFHAACVLVCGFTLSENDALVLMREYNQSCQPAWSERELLHKVQQAAKQGGTRGFLRNVPFEKSAMVRVPTYKLTDEKEGPRITTLVDSAKAYVKRIRSGEAPLIELGIEDVDYAIGGGVEKGEFIIVAARPSHGKSAVALQFLHHWTKQGSPCAIASEEMSALALGKRTLQFVTPLPQEHWSGMCDQLDTEIEAYAQARAKCLVLESVGTTSALIETVGRAVEYDGVERVVVDYAQLLRGNGRSRFDQMSDVSSTLRRLTSRHNLITTANCQLKRDVEERSEWKPQISDIKESGQFEQDADVIIFLCWPWRIDETQDKGRYLFTIGKNRNRVINQRNVDCTFDAARQTVLLAAVNSDHDYESPFPSSRKDRKQ